MWNRCRCSGGVWWTCVLLRLSRELLVLLMRWKCIFPSWTTLACRKSDGLEYLSRSWTTRCRFRLCSRMTGVIWLLPLLLLWWLLCLLCLSLMPVLLSPFHFRIPLSRLQLCFRLFFPFSSFFSHLLHILLLFPNPFIFFFLASAFRRFRFFSSFPIHLVRFAYVFCAIVAAAVAVAVAADCTGHSFH